VREFVEKAFGQVGTRIEWVGSGIDEKGMDGASGQVLVEVDKRYFRPTEVDALIGDASKARLRLGWQHKISFDDLVAEMVAWDLKAVAGETSRQLILHD
jgi:GDPmannose 4,6-dehydratase